MDYKKQHKELCVYLHQGLYLPKNEAYGDSFNLGVKKYGLISALTRMSDKWLRVENIIMGGGNRVADESLEDTLLDLANYCLMTVMALRAEQVNKNDKKEGG